LSSPLFLDTAYVYAIVNPNDQWHAPAVSWQSEVVSSKTPLVTTEFILTEIADGLSAVKFRNAAAQIVRTLQLDASIEIVTASTDLFCAGFDLYEARTDKDWGLTDCISFVVMTRRGITGALTTDDHFRQAGFQALLTQT